jgi:hypothetical protein
VRRRLQVSSLALLAWACACAAQAHGGLWRVNGLHLDPGGSGRLVLQSFTRGIVMRERGSKSWQWLCSETFGRDSTAMANVSMTLSSDGRLWIAALTRGLLVSTSSPCRFESLQGLDGLAIRDVVRGRDRMLALALANEAMSGPALYSAAETSSSFSTLGAPLPSGFSASSLRETEQGALLVAGSLASALMLLRSDDQAAHWQTGATMTVSSQLGWDAKIVEVTRDGKIIFVLVDELEWADASASHDALYVSDDGGMSLRLLFSDGTPIGGVAIAPDGSDLMIASVGGLHRAALADALTRGQASFTKLFAEPFFGLRWSEDGLYAGRDEFSASAQAGFSLGLSRDRGQSFERVMGVCDVIPMQCAAGSEGAARCPLAFDDQGLSGGGFKQDFQETRCTTSVGAGLGDAGSAPLPSDAGSEPVDAAIYVEAATGGDADSAPPAAAAPSGPRRSANACALRPSAREDALDCALIICAAVCFGQRRSRRARSGARTGGRR